MSNEPRTHEFRELPIIQLQESPTNPRRTFDEAKLQELAQSIRAQGIVVPLIARPVKRNSDLFEIVAGARRFRAAQMAELESVPVRVVRLSDEQALEWQLIENAIREDVHPYEEAMAYRTLLESRSVQHDVSAIATKTGKSLTHIYSRLKLAELVPAVAEAFQANRLSTAHAIQIARLPQEQQEQALAAVFRQDWRAKETVLVPIREFAQWIRDNLTLTLADAVFDRENGDLFPEAGSCSLCTKRSGANTVLFEDFCQDDRCLDGECFRSKVDAHIALHKQQTPGLVQITRGYHNDSDSEEPILTRAEYTLVEKEANRCKSATAAIAVEGPGKRGELVEICTDPQCPTHGKPVHQHRQVETQKQESEWKRHQTKRLRNQERNSRLLEAVLEHTPDRLDRSDLQMFVEAAVDGSDPWDRLNHLAERHSIDIDQYQEPDGLTFEFRKLAESANHKELIRMLFEIALIPSGYSDEALEANDVLRRTAERLNVTLDKPKGNKKARKNAAGKDKRTKDQAAKQRSAKRARGGAA